MTDLHPWQKRIVADIHDDSLTVLPSRSFGKSMAISIDRVKELKEAVEMGDEEAKAELLWLMSKTEDRRTSQRRKSTRVVTVSAERRKQERLELIAEIVESNYNVDE